MLSLEESHHRVQSLLNLILIERSNHPVQESHCALFAGVVQVCYWENGS